MGISVIIPTHNREKTIERSIRSVLAQTYPVDEIIIVDDCSTDNTEEVVSAIDDERIKYIKNDVNKGAAGARNVGIENASFDIIAFQDSDDEWLPQKIEKQMKIFKEHPECSFVYCSFTYPENGTIIPESFGMPRLGGDMLNILLAQNTAGTVTVVVKKELIAEIGGFNEELRALEDWEFAIRASKVTKFGYVPEPMVYAYRTQGSVSGDSYNYLTAKCMIISAYKDDYIKYGLFDKVVRRLFTEAKQVGIAEQIEKLLTLLLSQQMLDN